MTDNGVFQVVMLDVLRQDFEAWLRSRSLEMRLHRPDPTGVPTFIVVPTEEAWRAMNNGGHA